MLPQLLPRPTLQRNLIGEIHATYTKRQTHNQPRRHHQHRRKKQQRTRLRLLRTTIPTNKRTTNPRPMASHLHRHQRQTPHRIGPNTPQSRNETRHHQPVVFLVACVAGCGSENSAGEFGDVSAESAKARAPSDPASLFKPSNLSKAFDAGPAIVSAKTVKTEFATIVVAANDKVHAVVSQGPTNLHCGLVGR